MIITFDTETPIEPDGDYSHGSSLYECERILGQRFLRLVNLSEMGASAVIIENEKKMIATALAEAKEADDIVTRAMEAEDN